MADLDDIDPDDIPVAHDDDDVQTVPDPDPDAVAQEDEDDAGTVPDDDDGLSAHPLNPRPTGT